MSMPMPGWYPDPEAPERQRFWDGTQWTEARAYPESAVAASAPEQIAEAEESRNAWRWVAVIALIAAALLAAAYFLFLRPKDEPAPVPTFTPQPTVTNSVTVAPTRPTAPVTPPVTPPLTPTVTPPASP